MKITEDDKVSIGVMLVLIGAVVFVVRVDGKAETAQTEASTASRVVRRIDKRLARIEGAMGIKAPPEKDDGE